MKLCAIQIPFVKRASEITAAVDMAVDFLDSCDDSCDMILTPEYTNAPAAFPVGECIPFAVSQTPKLLDAARRAAVRCNAIVAVNYVCEAEKGLFRNTTEVFDRQGKSAGRFYKQHLPRAEKNVNLLDEEYTRKFRAPTIVEVDGIRLGFLICYDTYFTEYIAHLAHARPDVVLISSFQRAERQDVLRMQCGMIAFNCNAFVLRSSVSMGEKSTLGGNSMIVAPEGEILAEFGNQLGVLSCEVGDVKRKFMRSNSFGGAMIPNDQFVEQARATWCYRPAGSMTVEGERKMDYPRLCAHRGFSAAMPENTLPALGAAIALGASEIEIDVRFTADGVPVISHDSRLDRVSDGSGTIEEHTFEELRQLDFGVKHGEKFAGIKIASFEEVLSKFSRHAIINLHLKSIDESKPYPEEWMRKVVDLLYMYDSQEHVYFMGSPDVMITALKLAPEIPRCMAHLTGDPWGIVERAIKYQCCKVQLFAPWYNQEMIDKAHANNILCNLFYCDDPDKINDLFAMKIDTILTNNYVAVSAASQVK